jgi:hypothetical protein
MGLAEPLQAELLADLLVAAATKTRSPGGVKPSRASEAIATALAATWFFMSSAPRPQTWSSTGRPTTGRATTRRVGDDRVGVREEAERRAVAAASRATRFARSGTRA